jgi:hypothetical protein
MDGRLREPAQLRLSSGGLGWDYPLNGYMFNPFMYGGVYILEVSV